MSIPSGESGHAKEPSLGRRVWVQGDCIRVTGSWDCSCSHMWRGGGKVWRFALHKCPSYVYSYCLSYFTLRPPNWIHKGLQASCYHFQLKNGSSKPLLRHYVTLQRQLPSTPIFFPVLYILPIRHMCTAWLYTWQELSLLHYSQSLISDESNQLNTSTA